MSDETFQRGQVEEALWAIQWIGRTPTGRPPADIPMVFRTRIKRLLDIDREDELTGLEDGDVQYAFLDEKPSGQGQHVEFSAFDTFSLAIGIELLGGGFKQLDVVVLMRAMREPLRREFNWIQKFVQDHDIPDYRRALTWTHKKAPELPIFIVGGREFADHRVYVIIRKLELTEIYPSLERKLAQMKLARIPPIFVEPQFVRGLAELQENLHQSMPHGYRIATLVEISRFGVFIPQELRKTSAAKRGPK